MAKAQFQRNQRVWAPSVGTWATVERIVPIWAKGFDEPVKITYDVGLGREFSADELRAEDQVEEPTLEDASRWRVLRARNKWQNPDDCAHHPQPGSYPVVVTDPQDWGGWRVPGAEYDRDPKKIETQARLIVASPKLFKIARDLQQFLAEDIDDAPPELQDLAQRCAAVLRFVVDSPAPPASAAATDAGVAVRGAYDEADAA